MPTKLLRLPSSAYAPGRGSPPLSPHSKCATEHLVRNYAERSEVWWGMFIEVWDRFMEEVQWLGMDPAMQLQSRHAKLCASGQGSNILWHGMW